MELSNVDVLNRAPQRTLGPKDIVDFIKKNYGITATNCAFRNIYGDTVGLFESDCNGGEDFYFVPTRQGAVSSSIDEVFMIPKDTVSEYKSRQVYNGGTYLKYQFNMRDATQIHSGIPSNPGAKLAKIVPRELPGDDLSYHELSARDRICIELRVPQTAHKWLNDLIKESIRTITF